MFRATMAVCLGVGVCACSFDQSGVELGDDSSVPADAASAVDATVGPDAAAVVQDAPRPDAPGPCLPWDWTPTNFDPCDPDLPGPSGQLNLGAVGTYTYDSTTSLLDGPGGSLVLPSALLSQPGGPDVRVVQVSGLSLGSLSTLEVRGAHPVVFAVYGDATVFGVVDASGENDLLGVPVPGPGADDGPSCGSGGGKNGSPSTSSTAGGGGAGGGAYGDDGGDGGDGQGGGHGPKGGKGAKGGSVDLSPLRGGCSGGVGGDAADATAGKGGHLGAGGGAIQLSARDSLELVSTVRAGGSGAGGGTAAIGGRAGGGGGGSGGAILLESDVLTISASAVICATGGSGGEGSSDVVPGTNGTDGSCNPDSPARTPNLISGGGDGGNGGFLATPKGQNATNGSGGGGGGGVGRIRLRGVSALNQDGAADISPQETN